MALLDDFRSSTKNLDITNFQVNVFQNQLQELQLAVNHIATIEHTDIGIQLKYLQTFLINEIRRLKQDLSQSWSKLEYVTELKELDQIALDSFKQKFYELTKILADVKNRELNTWHLIQILRLNMFRLCYILESMTGSKTTLKLTYDDLRLLINLAQSKKEEQNVTLHFLENEHGELLLKLKEIELSLENFRTLILKIKYDSSEMKRQIENDQIINNQIQEQAARTLTTIVLSTDDARSLLHDYKLVVNKMHSLMKLIYQTQNQIEVYHKSRLIFETQLEKYKHDTANAIVKRMDGEQMIINTQCLMMTQTTKLKQLELTENQLIKQRELLQGRIQLFENDKSCMLKEQQRLLDEIKQLTSKNQSLEENVERSTHQVKDVIRSYRQLLKDQTKQAEVTIHLTKTIDTNEQRLVSTRNEIELWTNQVRQQRQVTKLKELDINSHTKTLHSLNNCVQMTHEELNAQRSEKDQSKTEINKLKNKLQKLVNNEEPLANDVTRYQKNIATCEQQQSNVKLRLKQNIANVVQFKQTITKLTNNLKQNEFVLKQENIHLQRTKVITQQTKDHIKNLETDLKTSSIIYKDFREIYNSACDENNKLKREYSNYLFRLQLLGQRQSKLNSELKLLYNHVALLTYEQTNKDKIIAQLQIDIVILTKYSLKYLLYYKSKLLDSQHNYSQLRHAEKQLESQLKKKNHVHYWRTLMITSPDQYNLLRKFFILKKKLVVKTSKLTKLKVIYDEKQMLCVNLNDIYQRRENIIKKTNSKNNLKMKLTKQKRVRQQLINDMQTHENDLKIFELQLRKCKRDSLKMKS
ncbi:unnamed protein product [Didymodactylos carnosus]|uniref:Uncharacterized protein n=1 Tax=Didymodactylos carnosus TaxID=1234261 RepID=A0A8S2E1X2_9BILA|nr:unnamed protein product [Didymodactylos carnosus]CAF3879254.1 unnamed protein product [Didymodactylos carnosus]